MDFFNLEDFKAQLFTKELYTTNFFEVLIFFEAEGHVLVGDKNINLASGTFIFTSPYQRRQWFVDLEKTEGYALIFEKDFLGHFFSDELFVYRLQYFYNNTVSPILTTRERLFSFEHDIFEELLSEINNYQNDSSHILRSLLYYILIKLNRHFCEFHTLENETHLNNHAYLFKESLEQNYKTHQQVNDYASLLKISRITLNNSVKKQFGITATDMIKERIVSEIKNELLYSTKTISEIAYELNFSEPNNMIRLFKNKTNSSPAQFRLSYQIDS
ncbi:helix-turn-helix domain-containing protein [Winogradskyella sp. 3972H.M.0a.05]|uniref:helix-turn-helix domain-containing protein n=1 Tax=Winogradskyella sp. 3972H.M.0a.05 TaxID=2950277 RepID=UPI00339AF103